MGRYVDADSNVKELTGSGAKVRRGLGPIYDIIVDNIISPNTVMELGVGTTHSQLAWAHAFPDTKVVGVDIASPSMQLCWEKDLTTKQYANAQKGIEVLFSQNTPVPMDICKRVDIYYNKDAYSKDVANEVVASYGRLPLIVNDAWQAAPAHNMFLDAYREAITDDGILVQEKAGRAGAKGIDIHQMQKALAKGWRIFDCREGLVMEGSNPESEGYVAVWYTDNNKWDDKFNSLREIKDPVSQIDAKWHYDSAQHD